MILSGGHSVLVVEDERIVALDIQQTLQELGYDAFAVASSAEQAIAQASKRCPDVVLMDIRIVGQLDGIQTAEILRRQFDGPVIYLTAHADDATLERAKKTEPHGYLIKPVKIAELRCAIEVSLHKHKMEKRLRERERWFATTLHSIADAVVAVDLAGRVAFMNTAAEALTGTSSVDAVGRLARDVLHLMDIDGSPCEPTPLATALRENRNVMLEAAHLVNVATGTQRVINDSAAPVIDAGQTLGAVMVFRDVTEQKSLQKQLELSDRLASLGTMAAGVAHEVNNPLAVVLAGSGFLAEELAQHRAELGGGALTAAATHRLEEMALALADVQSAAERIGHIIVDLRSFSRPAPSHTGVVNIARCIDWAIRATALELRQRARLITRFETVPDVLGDEARLSQAFINLVMNAAQAIDPGNAEQNEVVVSTRTDELGWVVIEVSDTGSGIPHDVIGRIFEPFFTTKAAGVGTGLGLSICHGIVRSFGGQLRAESQSGNGTRFLVRLPPAPLHSEETVALANPTQSSQLRARLLVIDDEDLLLSLMARILRDHELVCVHRAEDALALIEGGQRFDVILSDLMMPTMTGMDFYEALLGRDPELAKRVIFLSGGIVAGTANDFLASVPNLRLQKPFEAPALREIVQQLLTVPAAAE
jgi:PAS domain S-box-containing protein